ncbi:MAG TPA: FAD-dependent oxidoreductase [Nocardioides sp.]|uniref:NAD(P)/FAD-dependent oxidoreductase n=1 Tax=Nocardioides sp. TaxID=35761 RepID=UPI002C3D7FFE|nr:FAD-dependent oxidoreductase [Nocardioides sp.]HTW18262.1 FAD-dependent oxidoreductase [Nocardioides sp.]
MGDRAGLDLEHGHLVVVGGGLATVRVVTTLRRKKFRGPVTVLCAEQDAAYDRPPLSKDVLAGDADTAPLPFDVTKLEVDLRLGTRAAALRSTPDGGTVVTEAGEEIAYDALLLATGAEPVRLPGDGEQLTLRTLPEALALRERLTPGARVVIIGASWIGAEVATAAHRAGCEVTCVEYGPQPLAGALGAEVGAATLPWWAGITLLTDTAVARVESDGVHLADGRVLPADLVVTGVGVRPDLAWLAGSGLATGRGILTDDRCRTNLPGVLAVGDVAQRWSERTGAHRLIEHWDDASMVATAAVASLLTPDAGPSYDPVPYFWSDQFGRKLQYVGAHEDGDDVEVRLGDDGSLARAAWSRDGVLTAWLGVDATKDVVKARAAVGGPASAVD